MDLARGTFKNSLVGFVNLEYAALTWVVTVTQMLVRKLNALPQVRRLQGQRLLVQAGHRDKDISWLLCKRTQIPGASCHGDSQRLQPYLWKTAPSPRRVRNLRSLRNCHLASILVSLLGSREQFHVNFLPIGSLRLAIGYILAKARRHEA